MSAGRPPAPSFLGHLGLLWALRVRLGLNRGARGGRLLPVLAFMAASAPSVVLAVTFFGLVRHPSVVAAPLWPDFILRLLGFVTTCVWVTWPVLSAGVDDHSELSRYANFPISSFRLMVASTLAGLFEPRSLVFYGPLLGATVGYATVRPQSWPLLVPLTFAAYVLFNAALSRVGLHLVLNVLRTKRSAEVLGGGFLLTLAVASLIPPVDTSWLFSLGAAGVSAIPDALVENATRALGRFPTGFAAHSLAVNARGDFSGALADLFALVELMLVAMTVAWGLLLDFHRQSGRGGATLGRTRAANPFAATKTVFSTLVLREALDLWNNPRARLLVAVPFVLAILLKVLSGRALVVFFAGDAADAWLVSSLCLYGSVVMGATFSQNAFAYDGHGFATFLTAPLDLGLVLRAKNLVHASAGALLALVVALFYGLYFRAGSWLDVGCALAGVAALLPVLLMVGNLLSVFFPVKYHANLKRRDRVPLLASMLGVGGAALGSAPLGLVLRALHGQPPDARAVAVVLAAAAAAWFAYWSSLPAATRLLERRRELVLRAVSRD